jgi:hypothetical protein
MKNEKTSAHTEEPARRKADKNAMNTNERLAEITLHFAFYSPH